MSNWVRWGGPSPRCCNGPVGAGQSAKGLRTLHRAAGPLPLVAVEVIAGNGLPGYLGPRLRGSPVIAGALPLPPGPVASLISATTAMIESWHFEAPGHPEPAGD